MPPNSTATPEHRSYGHLLPRGLRAAPRPRDEEPRAPHGAQTRDGVATESRTELPERNLDILRAFAVLCVLLDHLLESIVPHHEWAVWLGQAGVQAFFV